MRGVKPTPTEAIFQARDDVIDTSSLHYPSVGRPGRWRWRRLVIRGPVYVLVLVTLLIGAALAGWMFNPRDPVARTEIYQGVYYTCELLPDTDAMGGLMHVIEVDLTAPGIELFITPPDPRVVRHHAPWTHRLRYVWQSAYREDLAATTNATFFSCRLSKPGRPTVYVPGDLASSVQTIIADGQTVQISKDTRLLWFERDLTPHFTAIKDMDDETMQRVHFAIGSAGDVGFPLISRGAPRIWRPADGSTEGVRPRTAIVISSAGRRLWLMTIDRCEPNVLAVQLRQLGATDAIILDGGKSSTMVLGRDARHVRPGTVTGGRRPVATAIGIRARPLRR